MCVDLYRPGLDELWFKQALLADPDTMSYNRAWGGCVDFPKELWARWHAAWLGPDAEKDGRRFYRYLRERASGEFVGEVAWHWDAGAGRHVADAIVHARWRGHGYGAAGLELLCDAARERGLTELWDGIALDNPSIGLFLHHGFDEVERTDELVWVRRRL